MSEQPKPRVLLVFGGVSSEHEISCATAGGVLRALDPHRWDVVAVGIAPGGQWVPMSLTPETYDLRDTGGYRIVPGSQRVALLPGSRELIEYEVDERGRLVAGSVSSLGTIDVAFPLLHGPYGEDGTIQGLFEMHGLPYVGCGVNASAVCMDKGLAKTVLHAAGISCGKWVAFSRHQWETQVAELTEQIANELDFPLFVKPRRQGSSVGISKINHLGELEVAVKTAQQADPLVIVEQGMPGREIECGVLQHPDGRIQASAIGEIVVTGAEFYDYRAKYFAPDAIELFCPADIPHDVAERVREISLRAFQVLECEGLSRFDFFYDEETGQLSINEVNSLPGFTPFSMYPSIFAEVGVPYPQLVDTLLQEALERQPGLR